MLRSFRSQVSGMPRFWKRVILIAFDIVALSAALWLSFQLRYPSWVFPTSPDEMAVLLSASLIAIPIFIRMGLYRAVIRYIPEQSIWTIFRAMTLATIVWVMVVFLSEMAGRYAVPRSVPIIYWALGTIIIGSSRFAAKWLLWTSGRFDPAYDPVVIYGAGEAGAQLALALRRGGNRRIVGFVDDSRSLQGRDVAGTRVFAPTQIDMLKEQYGIREIIICMPSATTAQRKDIIARISGYGLKIRTLPHIADLANGRYLISQIREIDIDELLGRSSVPPDPALLRQMIEGRIIMVTGAGGSIGSELCRLIAKWSPRQLILFEANEFALYRVERELSVFQEVQILPILGSITNADLVDHAIRDNGVQVLFHAAAHKHVPLVEANVLEGVHNNVFGTLTVADAAFTAGVESFVLISSDKAVRPTNVMGATKRWAELIVHQKAIRAKQENSGQRFCAVRFGNVLGSNGSVVPLFKEQIANGGPLTLTDPGMTRYFMSIHEAAELIVQAGALSVGGDVFLLDMGSPVRISDLAENMVRLAGLSIRDRHNPNGDLEIIITGKRPGEKMFEELFYDEASVSPTRHPKILRAPSGADVDEYTSIELEKLRTALSRWDEASARKVLFNLIVAHDTGTAVETAV